MAYKMNLSRLLFLLFGLLLLIQTGAIFSIMLAEKQATEEQTLLIHTHKVIAQSQVYISHLIDAETGQRGFLLTGHQSYLEPYYSGLVSSKTDLTKLRELTADNPSQQCRLDNMGKLMHKKFDELQQTIDLRQRNRGEEALALVESGHGKRVMDSIRKLTDEFVHEEERLLTVRKATLNKEQSLLQSLFVAASLLLVAITLAIAFIFRERVIAPILELTDEIKGKTLDDSSLDTAMASANEVVRLKIVFREMYEQIEQKTSELNKLSLTDSLTGLDNRRSFHQRVDRIRLHCIRYKRPLSMMMLDVDHFKAVNDTYGHDLGDEILKMASAVICNALREVDVLARLGGDEFAIALPETPADEAAGVAERIRQDVEKIKIETEFGLLGITLSIGITELTDAVEGIEDMLKAADDALYKAKQNGRNRIEKQAQ